MAEEKMIRGTGSTCIFFHNWYLSQYRLEGKHPSLPSNWMHSLYINFSYKMVEIEIIGVRARPPFPCLRPGLDINRSRHRPVIASYKHSPYINLSHKK